MEPKVLLAHPFGNTFAYHAALALFEGGLLDLFATSFLRTHGDVGRRCFPELRAAPIRHLVREEAIRLALCSLPVTRLNGRSRGWIDWAGRRFDRRVADLIAPKHECLYAYEDFCATSYQRAKEQGVTCVYDLPIGFYQEAQEIFQLELENDGTLRPFLDVLSETPLKLDRKETEIRLADKIVVASTFTKNSILRHRPHMATRISVIPYGVEQPPLHVAKPVRDRPLRVLFAGTLGPRKGLHHLFEALQSIKAAHYRLTLAGPWVPGFEAWLKRRFTVTFDYKGRLPHRDLLALYSQNDVFAFPSLFEGFAMVILEAMAHGTTVVSTDRTAASDLFRDGQGGFIVRAGDITNLRERLSLLEADRKLVREQGDYARMIAQNWTWARYRQQLVKSLFSDVALEQTCCS